MPENQIKLFLGCLPGETTQEELSKYFRKIVPLKSIKVNFRKNGICAGYGNIICLNKKDAEKLINYKHTFKNRQIECRYYINGSKLQKYQREFNIKRLFINNIPKEFTDHNLFELFSKFGKVQKAYLGSNQNLLDNKFGFVNFEKRETKERVKKELIFVKGNKLVIKDVKKAKISNLKYASKKNKYKKVKNKSKTNKISQVLHQDEVYLLKKNEKCSIETTLIKTTRLKLEEVMEDTTPALQTIFFEMSNLIHANHYHKNIKIRKSK